MSSDLTSKFMFPNVIYHEKISCSLLSNRKSHVLFKKHFGWGTMSRAGNHNSLFVTIFLYLNSPNFPPHFFFSFVFLYDFFLIVVSYLCMLECTYEHITIPFLWSYSSYHNSLPKLSLFSNKQKASGLFVTLNIYASDVLVFIKWKRKKKLEDNILLYLGISVSWFLLVVDNFWRLDFYCYLVLLSQSNLLTNHKFLHRS